MSQMMKKIGELPFVYAPLDTPHNPEPIPDRISFSLEMRNGVISQVFEPEIEKALDEAYRLGSMITGQMNASGNGKEYADEFIEYIQGQAKEFEGKEVLEIGCGVGYLLSEIQKWGANCTGVEPGEKNVAAKKEVVIVQDFFRKELFDKKFDIIIFYGVLEHIYDMRTFLRDVRELLKDGGKVLIGVPNCEGQIERGDISILLHEHWSYFTRNSLEMTLNTNGLKNTITLSETGGVLFACAEKNNVKESIDGDIEAENRRFNLYSKYYDTQRERLANFFIKAKEHGESIGIFPPCRGINWLSVVSEKSELGEIRFIDDNPIFQNKYYPSFECPIESLEKFMSKPAENVLIPSYSYGKAIKKRLIDYDYQGKLMDIKHRSKYR